MSVDYDKAVAYARAAHDGQERQYTGEPYIFHPIRVSGMAAAFGLSEEAQIAAVLHDVVEDCGKLISDIECRFGEHVADLVHVLTDRQTPKDGNRAMRKEQYACRISAVHDVELHTLKILDLLDNAPSIIEYDPSFAKVFVGEAYQLIEACDLAKNNAVLRLRDALYTFEQRDVEREEKNGA